MKKEKNEENMVHPLRKGATEEVLEISSTGYGLESVTKPVNETENPSCGGL